MQDAGDFLILNRGIVVTAQSHNPSILNPDFLDRHKIALSSWEVSEAITTPPLSMVKYTNGITVNLDESRLTVVRTPGNQIGDTNSIYGLVERYITRLRDVPYRSLGLNWKIAFPQAGAQAWLMKRFLKRGRWLKRDPQLLAANVSFVFDAKDAKCNLRLRTSKATFPNRKEQEESILSDCNFHHDGPFEVPALKSLFKRWPEREQFLIDLLNRLLIEKLA